MAQKKGAYKSVQREHTVDELWDVGEIEELAEEMRSWHDNLQGTPAENTQKAETVGETADTLENAVQELQSACDGMQKVIEEIQVFELDDPLRIIVDRKVQVTSLELRTKRRYGPSRATRLSNAIAPLTALAEVARGLIESIDGFPEPVAEAVKNMREALDEYATELENQVAEVEGVEFPGLYG